MGDVTKAEPLTALEIDRMRQADLEAAAHCPACQNGWRRPDGTCEMDWNHRPAYSADRILATIDRLAALYCQCGNPSGRILNVWTCYDCGKELPPEVTDD